MNTYSSRSPLVAATLAGILLGFSGPAGAAEGLDRATTVPERFGMVPTVHDDRVLLGKAVRGEAPPLPTDGAGQPVTVARGRRNTPPGVLQGTVRVSRGLALASRTNNPRGQFSSMNVRLERGPHITRDGQYVVFQSGATNLVPNDTDGQGDIFRLKLSDGSVTQVDTYDGTNAQVRAQYSGDFSNSMCPAASADGRYIAFYTDKQLAADDSDILQDCYLKDMTSGACKRLSGGIYHPERGTNPCIGGTVDFTYYTNVWGLDISNDGQHVAFLFPDATLCDSYNSGVVYPNGYIWNWSGSIGSGSRQLWTQRSAATGPPTYYSTAMSDIRISGDGRLIAFWSSDDLGIGTGTTLNLLGLNLDSSGNFTVGAFYVLNTSSGVPGPGGSTATFPIGSNAGPTSVSDNAAGRLLGYLSNVSSPSSGRSIFAKNLTATTSQGLASGRAIQFTDVCPIVSPGSDPALPGNSLFRYQNQNYMAPSGNKIYVTTSYDYSHTPFPDHLPDQGSYAEGTTYERMAIHEISGPFPVTQSGTTYFGTSRHLANYPGTSYPPDLAAHYRPTVDTAGTRLLFTAADAGVTKEGQSAFNYDLCLTDLATRAFTPLLAPQTIAGQTNDHSEGSALSADGLWVVYTTAATNIETADNNRGSDVVLFSVATGTSSIISKGVAGIGANAPANSTRGDRSFLNASGPSINQLLLGPPAPTIDKSTISDDGRRVAFTSTATNLTMDTVPTVGGQVTRQVFLFDRITNTTTLVSKNAAGEVADNFNYRPALSGDGALVAWLTTASNLGYTAPAGVQQVVMKDLSVPGALGPVTLVSKSVINGGWGASHNSYSCMIGGAAGSYRVVYDSAAMDITELTDATNDYYTDNFGIVHGVECFLYDVASDTNLCVSLKSDGTPYKSPSWNSTNGPSWDSQSPAISRNGRYVVFSSDANLLPGDPTPATPNVYSSAAPRSLYWYDTQVGSSGLKLVNVDSSGAEVSEFVDDGAAQHDQGVRGTAAAADDGNTVFFLTEQPLDPMDHNKSVDLYAKSMSGDQGVARVALEDGLREPGSLGGKFEFDAGGYFSKPTRIDSPTISSTSNGHVRGGYSSDNPNLVTGDSNGHYDIFLADFLLGEVPGSCLYHFTASQESVTPTTATSLVQYDRAPTATAEVGFLTLRLTFQSSQLAFTGAEFLDVGGVEPESAVETAPGVISISIAGDGIHPIQPGNLVRLNFTRTLDLGSHSSLTIDEGQGGIRDVTAANIISADSCTSGFDWVRPSPGAHWTVE